MTRFGEYADNLEEGESVGGGGVVGGRRARGSSLGAILTNTNTSIVSLV